MSAEPITPTHDPHAAVELGVPRPVDDLSIDELRESPERFVNRELSWLDFDARVLALAADRRQPLLERAKFLAIFSQNLDEFFQVRVAGLKDQVAAGLGKTTPDGRSAATQLAEIRARLDDLSVLVEAIFDDEIVPGLAENGIVFSGIDDLDEDDRDVPRRLLRGAHLPGPHAARRRSGPSVPVHLRPLAQPGGGRARPGQRRPPLRPGEGPEPAAPLRGDARRRALRARSSRSSPPTSTCCSPAWSRGCTTPSGSPATPTSPSRRRRPTTCWRRSSSSCAAAASGGPCASRSTPRCSEEILDLLTRELDLAPDDVYHWNVPLDLGGLWSVHGLDRPELKDEPWVPDHPAPTHQPRPRRAGRPVLGHPRGRRARAPPLRVVLQFGRGVHPPGVARPPGPRHQAHPLPHLLRHARSSSRWSGPPRRASRWRRWSS